MGKILGLGFFFLLTLGVNLGFLLPWLVNDLGDLGLLLLPVDLAVFGALGSTRLKLSIGPINKRNFIKTAILKSMNF
jgi:hypothetical protein